MTGPKQKNSTALLVFLKYPVPGQVKTRLAKSLGNEKACEIYLELLHQVFALVSRLPRDHFTVYAVYDSSHPLASYQRLLSEYEVKFFPQSQGDLGDRLSNAFQEILVLHRKALAIGTDCVTISNDLLHTASQSLTNDTDCVVGPSEDGGYYLIGMSKAHCEIFNEISWSSSSVFNETLEKISGLSLRARILNRLADIDTESDYQNYLLRQQSTKTFV